MALMDKVRCPNCNTVSVVSHCRSTNCHWYRCSCEKTATVDYLVFDKKARTFLKWKAV